MCSHEHPFSSLRGWRVSFTKSIVQGPGPEKAGASMATDEPVFWVLGRAMDTKNELIKKVRGGRQDGWGVLLHPNSKWGFAKQQESCQTAAQNAQSFPIAVILKKSSCFPKCVCLCPVPHSCLSFLCRMEMEGGEAPWWWILMTPAALREAHQEGK